MANTCIGSARVTVIGGRTGWGRVRSGTAALLGGCLQRGHAQACQSPGALAGVKWAQIRCTSTFSYWDGNLLCQTNRTKKNKK